MNNHVDFEVRTLEASELELVSGGCTFGTVSVCHIDGEIEPTEEHEK